MVRGSSAVWAAVQGVKVVIAVFGGVTAHRALRSVNESLRAPK
jgi:hypothetical protein